MLRRGITTITNIAQNAGVQCRTHLLPYSKVLRVNSRSLLSTSSLTPFQMFTRRLLPLNSLHLTDLMPIQRLCYNSTVSKQQVSSGDLGDNMEATRVMNVIEGDAMGMSLHVTNRAIKVAYHGIYSYFIVCT
jgi:hypothetical protein